MSNKLTKEQIDYIDKVPTNFRALFKKCLTKEIGKAPALKAKCQECVGYEETISRIRDCPTWRCPLWRYRPYQKKA